MDLLWCHLRDTLLIFRLLLLELKRIFLLKIEDITDLPVANRKFRRSMSFCSLRATKNTQALEEHTPILLHSGVLRRFQITRGATVSASCGCSGCIGQLWWSI